jgi:hypothetical protein
MEFIPDDITFDDGTSINAESGETATGEVSTPSEGPSFSLQHPRA